MRTEAKSNRETICSKKIWRSLHDLHSFQIRNCCQQNTFISLLLMTEILFCHSLQGSNTRQCCVSIAKSLSFKRAINRDAASAAPLPGQEDFFPPPPADLLLCFPIPSHSFMEVALSSWKNFQADAMHKWGWGNGRTEVTVQGDHALQKTSFNEAGSLHRPSRKMAAQLLPASVSPYSASINFLF